MNPTAPAPNESPTRKQLTTWVAGAAAAFLNGCIAGLPAGSGGGGGSAGAGVILIAEATGKMPDASTLAYLGAGGFVSGVLGNGLKHLLIWHASNPLNLSP